LVWLNPEGGEEMGEVGRKKAEGRGGERYKRREVCFQ
jgi:hypothetical protein